MQRERSGRFSRLGARVLFQGEKERRRRFRSHFDKRDCDQSRQRYRRAIIAIATDCAADNADTRPGKQVTAG